MSPSLSQGLSLDWPCVSISAPTLNRKTHRAGSGYRVTATALCQDGIAVPAGGDGPLPFLGRRKRSRWTAFIVEG